MKNIGINFGSTSTIYCLLSLYYLQILHFFPLSTLLSLFVTRHRRSRVSKKKQMMNEKEDIMSEPFIVKTINDEEATPRDYEFNHNNPQGNTSFSKTCFHGINALSGLFFHFFLNLFSPSLICSTRFILISKFYNSRPRF